MKIKFIGFLIVFFFILVLVTGLFYIPPKVFAAHSRVGLGTADNFAVLAGSAVTGTNTNVITGDVGLSPSAGSFITLLTCSEVTGTIYDTNGGYTGGGGGSTACLVTNAGLLTTAKNDLTTAYNDAAGRTTTSTVATNLGGTTLTDGTYVAASNTFSITGGQTLTLDGEGNADSVFIFKMGTTLITGSSSSVVLTNGAQACNVYWQVGSSATLGTSTTFVGNIMADQSITDDGSSTVNGRLLASVAAVTLNNTTVTKSTCAAGTSGGPALSTSSTSNSSSSSTGTTTGPDLNTFIAPTIIDSRRIDLDSIFISWGPYSGINTFIVQYGLQNGDWLYSTNVTGFSTTINDLPINQPIWVRIAARDNNSIGKYADAQLVGGPRLPNTGFVFDTNKIPSNPFHFYLNQGQTQNTIQYPETLRQILGIEVQKEIQGIPVRLRIPSINVDTAVVHMGLTLEGAMEAPNNTVDVGWFDLGVRPGETGSAVISGHFDGENGSAGVFANLHTLKTGDKVYIQDDKGVSTPFIVGKSRIYDPGYAEEVFSSNDGAHLNLITCDGVWDGEKKSYSKRLVVFADITD